MKQLFTWFLAFFLTFGSMHAWTVQAKDGADDNQAQDMQDEDEDDADETENDEDEDDATPSLTAETMSDCTMDAQDQVFIDKFSTKLDKVFATWNTEKRMKIKEAMEKMMSKFPEGRVHCLVKALHIHLVKLNESTPAPTTEMSLMDKIKARLAGLLGEKGKVKGDMSEEEIKRKEEQMKKRREAKGTHSSDTTTTDSTVQ